MNELALYLPVLYEKKDESMSFLLRAPSGWGKTRMGFMIANYLTGGEFEYIIADQLRLNFRARVIFIDEVHLLRNTEMLYPLIDAKKNVFLFATNEVAVLPEALTNRCVNLIFEDYKQNELRTICSTYLPVGLRTDFVDYIIQSSGSNPRIIKNNCFRINLLRDRDRHVFDNCSFDEFKGILSSIFGIKDGLDNLCNRYMEALKSLGGTASLHTISTAMHMDQGSVRFQIEPILLHKKLINIGSKGRSLVENVK